MTERAARKSALHPRLVALGWDRDDPTALIRKGLAKLEEATDEAAKKVVAEIEASKHSSRTPA